MSKYKLRDDAIFKPKKRVLTPEEEQEEDRKIELFFDMLEKNGIACLNDPSRELTHEQLYEDIRNGRVIIGNYDDWGGEHPFSKRMKHIMDGGK